MADGWYYVDTAGAQQVSPYPKIFPLFPVVQQFYEEKNFQYHCLVLLLLLFWLCCHIYKYLKKKKTIFGH